MAGPTDHQNLQPFPRLNSPLTDPETGRIEPPWYRFLIGLWQRIGGSSSSFPLSVFAQQEGGTVSLFNSQTGEFLGSLGIDHVPQEIPFDLASDPGEDIKQALMIATPPNDVDQDQLVMSSLAITVPISLVP